MYFKELFILYTKTMSNFSVLVILSGQKDSNFHCYCIRVVSYNRLDDVPILSNNFCGPTRIRTGSRGLRVH